MSQPLEQPDDAYFPLFVRDEVILVVEHNPLPPIEDPEQDPLPNPLTEWVQQFVDSTVGSMNGNGEPGSVENDDGGASGTIVGAVTLPPNADSRATSLFHVNVQALQQPNQDDDENAQHTASDVWLAQFVDTLNNQIPGYSGAGADNDEPDPVQEALSPQLQKATPNWYFSAMPHQLIDGGPGGKPVPVSDVPSEDDYTLPLDHIDSLIEQARPVGYDPTSVPPVDVIILDTAPVLDIEAAANKYSDNCLLKKLKDSHRLTIVRAKSNGIDLPLPPPENGDETQPSASHMANYPITDHGLFVAGTIHNIAPEANLYLIEVLNSHGVGTIGSLTQGIGAMASVLDHTPHTVIVNCSLCISFKNEQMLGATFGNWIAITLQNLRDKAGLLASLRAVIDTLMNQGAEVRVLAAAGNDGTPDHPDNPPQTRFPAAYADVIGVGALDQNGSRAWYSNIADIPASAGLMIFGGKLIDQPAPSDLAAHKVDSDSSEGMLGLYVGDFPDGTPSANGWARWAGTSFATAVLSGCFAKAAVNGIPIGAGITGNFYDVLKDNPAGQTQEQERIV